MKSVATLAVCLILSVACTNQSAVKVPPVAVKSSPSVSVMTFNVENLFDTTHDANKDDYTFLPKAAKDSDEHRARCNAIEVKKWREQCLYWDWSEQALEFKLSTLAEVIKQENGGRGPDIIAFQEVENISVLERLRGQYLQGSGYFEPVLVEGNDIRGIDVAFLTRLPVVGQPKLHPIAFKDISERRRADTRGILQADFRLPDGQVLTGYSVHFPAPFHPHPLRIDAYNSLSALLDGLPANRLAFAAGDFNTTAPENKEHKMLDRFAKSKWLIAHELGCEGCRGTSYYAPRDDWSFLDMIMVRKSTDGSGSWTLNRSATRLVNQHPQQRDENGNPLRFSVTPQPRGVSDHWPLLIELDSGEKSMTQPRVN
ncbi:MAG: endonuclease/exonuclease/phosphatase family protein [Gammaproteobacteria bacterium]